MKEQILHLDPHDDFISARDKMGWTQTQRVLVVWPAQGRVLTRRLDLVLLHRHAHLLGAHMAIISVDEDVRENASDLGLPVFSTLSESRQTRWRSRVPAQPPPRRQPPLDPERFKPRPPLVRRPRLTYAVDLTLRSVALGVGLLAPLAMAFVSLPVATVTVTPAAREVTATVEVVAEPNLSQPLGAFVPARAVRVEVETSGFVATTGLRDVPDARARGAVVFTNLAGTPVTIPAGTSVRTTAGAPLRFATTIAVNLEGRRGATVTVEILAAEPGPDGNVGASRINTIDGPLGLQIAVTNPKPTDGGTVSQRAAVAQVDRDQIRAQLLAQLLESGGAALEAQLQPGEFLAEGTVAPAQIITETYDHSVGEAADTLALTLRIALTGLGVTESDVRGVAQSALEAMLQAGESLAPGQIRFTRQAGGGLDGQGRAHLTLIASGSAAPHLDSQLVRRLIVGRTLLGARERLLAALALEEPPRIDVWPGWFGRLPVMLFRIKVVAP